jgi:hypothetical protein
MGRPGVNVPERLTDSRSSATTAAAPTRPGVRHALVYARVHARPTQINTSRAGPCEDQKALLLFGCTSVRGTVFL